MHHAGDIEHKEVKVAEAEAIAHSLRCAHVIVSNCHATCLIDRCHVTGVSEDRRKHWTIA